MKKKTTGNSLFYQVFVGEFVEMMTTQRTIITEQHEDQLVSSEHPWTVRGYLLDEDDQYYYIGIEPTEIVDAIKKEFVINVSISSAEEIQMKTLPPATNMEDLN